MPVMPVGPGGADCSEELLNRFTAQKAGDDEVGCREPFCCFGPKQCALWNSNGGSKAVVEMVVGASLGVLVKIEASGIDGTT
ncbi:hypothetical protein NDU88_003594 [Pleurodeles waltl]|uniref:Uncharacterized protein n=1 Tax=Pleurodeles waltl TaxID=8319 RepID=A0AAV7SGD6_PLEWA|nr:hypothetical protein NDU88_003594 [Pleurodeles waltl]